MQVWTYDKTFEGFLTLVFDCFNNKIFPDKIIGKIENQTSLFGNTYEVYTDDVKTKRVWSGLHKRISEKSSQMLYYAFLSEVPEIESLMLRYVRKVFDSNINIEANFGDESVLELFKIRQKVTREAQRILMFVRFQKTADNMYYASFDPMYNVLPLVVDHFEKRFADQKWVIYDTRRDYGFYYDLKTTSEIHLAESMVNYSTGSIDDSIMAEDEKQFQKLWKNYFDAMCIKERVSSKRHVQLLPKRFWKYLPEKQARND